MGGLGPDHAHQLLLAVYRHAHAGQDPRVHPADIAHAQGAVLLDLHHHQPDLVDVGAEDHLGPLPLHMGDDIVEPVDLDLIRIGAESRRHMLRHCQLIARQAG